MTYRIEEIEGIGPAFAEKLAAASIDTTEKLLELCCDAKGRNAVAEKSGLSEAQLLKWANMADLMRINGVGGEFAELLEASGVDTVKELRMRSAANLAAKMKEVNDAKTLTRALPSEKTVLGWIEQAGSMEPKVTH